jgi:hypothetical protein
MPVIITKPGMYEGLAEADYHADPVPEGSLSCSGAKLLLPPSCPAKYAWSRKHPPEPKAVFEFGTAAHREVLGTGWPIEVWEGTDWKTKASQEWRKEQRAAGRVPILANEREQITAMAAAIRAHPTASLLLNAEEVMAERSLFWQDEEFGIWRRSRLDAVRLSGRVIITDYKTAVTADPREWSRNAANFGYHWQDPWYREAVICTLGDADPAFLFVVQEKTPPYLVAVYELDELSIEAGQAKIRAACREYARCTAAGEWPGYQPEGETVTRISLPAWAL